MPRGSLYVVIVYLSFCRAKDGSGCKNALAVLFYFFLAILQPRDNGHGCGIERQLIMYNAQVEARDRLELTVGYECLLIIGSPVVTSRQYKSVVTLLNWVSLYLL